jgi:hypothetical protein
LGFPSISSGAGSAGRSKYRLKMAKMAAMLAAVASAA